MIKRLARLVAQKRNDTELVAAFDPHDPCYFPRFEPKRGKGREIQLDIDLSQIDPVVWLVGIWVICFVVFGVCIYKIVELAARFWNGNFIGEF